VVGNSFIYFDPWMYAILLRIGPALKDLTVHGLQFIMPDMFDDIPNLTALRLYSHHDGVQCGILPERFRNIITLEFVGEDTYPRPIVQQLLAFNFTPLRALAIMNPLVPDSIYFPGPAFASVHVNDIKALGMY